MTRTFIALEMNGAMQRHLAEVIRQVAHVLPGIRWVNPTGIHLTLAFLGELDDMQLEEAKQAAIIAAQGSGPFSYRLSHLGVFGSPRQPRVIWIGIDEPTGALNHLHRLLNRELAQRGFEIDRRPFSPHLTLSRVKAPLSVDEQNNLQDLLKNQRRFASPRPYSVSSIHVMKSELAPAGAQYTPLHLCPLGHA